MESFRDNSSSQEDMINQFNDIENLTIDEINNYGRSEYVSSYYYTYSINMDGKDLEEATDSLVKETTKTETTTQQWGSEMPSGFPGGMGQPPEGMNFFGGNKINGVVNINQIDNIEAVVDFEVLAKLLVIGLALTMFSSISACISIARFSPLTILKERS